MPPVSLSPISPRSESLLPALRQLSAPLHHRIPPTPRPAAHCPTRPGQAPAKAYRPRPPSGERRRTTHCTYRCPLSARACCCARYCSGPGAVGLACVISGRGQAPPSFSRFPLAPCLCDRAPASLPAVHSLPAPCPQPVLKGFSARPRLHSKRLFHHSTFILALTYYPAAKEATHPHTR
jgi:hypothetical protein